MRRQHFQTAAQVSASTPKTPAITCVRCARARGRRTSLQSCHRRGDISTLSARGPGFRSADKPIVYEADSSQGPVVVSGGAQVPKSSRRGKGTLVSSESRSLASTMARLPQAGCGGNCTGFAKAGLVFANRSMVLVLAKR